MTILEKLKCIFVKLTSAVFGHSSQYTSIFISPTSVCNVTDLENNNNNIMNIIIEMMVL